jgi:PKD repeat protein
MYSICSGEPVTFTASPSHVVDGNITWSLGGTPRGIGSQFTITNFQSIASHDITASAIVSPGPGQCLSTVQATSTYAASNITVTPPVIPGAIGSDQTICYGETPNPLTSLVSASGGTGTISYQWQYWSNVANDWVNVISDVNATLAAYPPGALTATTVFRRKALNHSCMASTPGVLITVAVPPPLTLSINDPGPSCDFSGFTFTAVPSIAGGSPIYRWYRYSGTWNDASPPAEVDHNDASENTFRLPPDPNYEFQDGEKIRCVAEFDIGCRFKVKSNEVIIDYHDTVVPNLSIVPNTYSICGSGSVTFTASASHALNGTIKWSLGPPGQQIQHGTGSEFTITNFQNSIGYNVSASASVLPGPGQCLSSNIVSATFEASNITVTPYVDPGSIASSQLICLGTRASPLTNLTSASGGSGTISYQWQSSPDGVTVWTPISGATQLTYAPGALTETTSFLRTARNYSCEVSTAAVTITVKPRPNLYSVLGGGPVCSGNNNGITLTHSDTGTKIEWPATATGKYTVKATAECTLQMSGLAHITSITPLPTPALAGADRNLCNASSTALEGNPATSGTGLWTVKTGAATFENSTLPNSNVTLGLGTNTLVWTIRNGPCKSEDEVTFKVANAPTSVSFSAERMMCAMKFTSPKVSGCNATYTWDFGDQTTSTERNPFHVYANAGTYPVSVTVTYNCSSICVGSLSASGQVLYTPTDGEVEPITLQVATDKRLQVLSNSASTFSDSWALQHEAGAVSDRNGYWNGSAGVWRNNASYVYDVPRHQSEPTVNIRTDGTYELSQFNWQRSEIQGIPNWIKANSMTTYSPYGYELENKDVMGVYSAAVYDYDGQLPVANGVNMRNKEMAYTGFEATVPNQASGNWIFGAQPQAAYSKYVINSGNRNLAVVEASPDLLATVVNVSLASRGGLPPGNNGNFLKSEIICMRPHPTNSSWSLVLFKHAPAETVWSGEMMVANAVGPADAVTLDGMVSHSGKSSLKIAGTDKTYRQEIIKLEAGKTYWASAWVSVGNPQLPTPDMGPNLGLTIALKTKNGSPAPGFTPVELVPNGVVIEGWKQVKGRFVCPANELVLELTFKHGASTAWYDDLRIHPENGNMKSYVYDVNDFRLKAILDEENFASLFYYDAEGNLYLTKKETKEGIKTLTENISYQVERER